MLRLYFTLFTTFLSHCKSLNPIKPNSNYPISYFYAQVCTVSLVVDFLQNSNELLSIMTQPLETIAKIKISCRKHPMY